MLEQLQAMVGTPPVMLTFSRSIISSASSTSHLRMKMVVWPITIDPIRLALHALTWKSGITIRPMRGSAAAGTSPRRKAVRASTTPPDNMLVNMLRWVPSAPLGLPVVPLV